MNSIQDFLLHLDRHLFTMIIDYGHTYIPIVRFGNTDTGYYSHVLEGRFSCDRSISYNTRSLKNFLRIP